MKWVGNGTKSTYLLLLIVATFQLIFVITVSCGHEQKSYDIQMFFFPIFPAFILVSLVEPNNNCLSLLLLNC